MFLNLFSPNRFSDNGKGESALTGRNCTPLATKFVTYALATLLFWTASTQSLLGETRADFVARMHPIEEVSEVLLPVGLSFADHRPQLDQNFDLTRLKKLLIDSLRAHDVTVDDSLSATVSLSPIDFIFQIAYFGTFQNDAGKWGVKVIAALDYESKVNSQWPQHFTFSYDQLSDKKKLKQEDKRQWLNVSIDETVRKVLAKILEVLKREGAAYRSVTALGCSPVSAAGDASKDEANALLEALRNVCERAWGVKIESFTQVKDITDISETVYKRYGCTLANFEILPQFSTQTSDSFKCIVVKAITQKTDK